MSEVRLGIDVACRADHRASLADDRGEFIWSAWRFRTTPADLEALWAKIPDGAEVVVVMEPTRNAWVPLAAWLGARGAKVVLVPPEQSADLRDYYNKHTKTDRLDSRVLARLPLLHPEGLRTIDDLGPAEPLRRAVRHRSSLAKRRTSAMQRLDALIELLGPVWADVLGTGEYTKTALAVLGRYADPRALKKLGRKRLAALLVGTSRGHFREAKADEVLAAADETIQLWSAGGLDFAELAADIAAEVRVIKALETELEAVEDRIEVLYHDADPGGIVRSAPGLGVTLAAGILGRTGDLNRFANLPGVRSFTGLVPTIDQSGQADHHGGPTKAGDPGLRQTLFMAADQARKVDPALAARYHRLVVDQGKHHISALCSIAPVLMTRIAACWRNGERYVVRDVDGREISETEGRAICAERYKVDPATRAARRRSNTAKQLKQRTSRRKKESTKAAPASGPSETEVTGHEAA
ncbi:MAG TPA: IS110 family transposase [Pseudonocardiaceae bacterium]